MVGVSRGEGSPVEPHEKRGPPHPSQNEDQQAAQVNNSTHLATLRAGTTAHWQRPRWCRPSAGPAGQALWIMGWHAVVEKMLWGGRSSSTRPARSATSSSRWRATPLLARVKGAAGGLALGPGCSTSAQVQRPPRRHLCGLAPAGRRRCGFGAVPIQGSCAGQGPYVLAARSRRSLAHMSHLHRPTVSWTTPVGARCCGQSPVGLLPPPRHAGGLQGPVRLRKEGARATNCTTFSIPPHMERPSPPSRQH